MPQTTLTFHLNTIIDGVITTWHDFWMIFHTYERASDLIELCQWAKHKRLSGVHRAYQHKLRHELISLRGAKVYRPTTMQWAVTSYKLSTTLIGKRQTYSTGSAARFRASIG